MPIRSRAAGGYTPATRTAISASIGRITGRRCGTGTSRMSSCSEGTSSPVCERSCAAPATDGSSAAISQCGSRSELEHEQREEGDEHEVAHEDPPRQHLAPVVDGAVWEHEAVPLGAGESGHTDE